MSVSLYCLLEGTHFLNFQKLTSPLLIQSSALVSLHFELIGESLLLLLQIVDFFLQLLDSFISLFILFTLETIDCFEKTIRVLDFVLNQRPQLLE